MSLLYLDTSAIAIYIKPMISQFVTYDKQLARAAELMGFEVAAPA